MSHTLAPQTSPVRRRTVCIAGLDGITADLPRLRAFRHIRFAASVESSNRIGARAPSTPRTSRPESHWALVRQFASRPFHSLPQVPHHNRNGSVEPIAGNNLRRTSSFVNVRRPACTRNIYPAASTRQPYRSNLIPRRRLSLADPQVAPTFTVNFR